MNLILLQDSDFLSETDAAIRDPRQLLHIRQVLRAKPGDALRVGRLNGRMGAAEILCLADDEIRLRTHLDTPPPPPLPLTLILGLPRPKMLRRTFQYIASAGVKHLILLHSARVEKSYWQTPALQPSAIDEQLWLGLEQGCDTVMPQVSFRRVFTELLEEIPTLIENTLPLVAHPYTDAPCPAQVNGALTLAVGPEGGFTRDEVFAFTQYGFQAVHLGPRIQRVEPVIPFLLGRLLP